MCLGVWLVGPLVASSRTPPCEYAQQGFRKFKFRAAEHCRLVETRKWVPSPAHARAPTPPRGHHERRVRCSVDKPRLSCEAVPCSAGRHDMSLSYQKRYCSCEKNGTYICFFSKTAVLFFFLAEGAPSIQQQGWAKNYSELRLELRLVHLCIILIVDVLK